MSDARPTICCPLCGAHRVVTARQHRRARLEGATPCATCRSGSDTRPFTDSHLRFWLETYDSKPAPRTPVRQFIAGGGAPPELVEMARSIFGR